MPKSLFDRVIIQALIAAIAIVLILMPFHAFLTVWAAQLVGHYTLLRLWKEGVLVLIGGGVTYLLITRADLRKRFLKSRLTWLIVAFIGVQIIWGICAYLAHHVSAKALGYGWVSDTRYLIFFLLVWAVSLQTSKIYSLWPKLVLWPAAVVIIFGLLQYFILPYNFMTHFGYSAATIFPYEDINSNTHYIRIMSTLRGANPLGAYLVVALSLGAALAIGQKIWRGLRIASDRRRLAYMALLLAAGLLALALTFSRSAWLGLVLSFAVMLWAGVKSQSARRYFMAGVLGSVVLGAVTVFGLRNNSTFQNIFFHTQTHSAVATTSNEGHVSALQNGLQDILHEPLGRGPGTAGPASVYNTGYPGRIAENYFIQIAQETGWLGLLLFLAINVWVAKELWERRRSTLALGLLGALIGLGLVNTLSHAWADDTLAYVWWGLAALALALPPTTDAKPPFIDDVARGH